MHQRSVLMAGIFASFLAAFGCNPAPKLNTIPASGTVTYNGKPVENATVTFFPADKDKAGRQAMGVTGSGGRFMLKTHVGGSQTESGAEANDYKVTIVLSKEPDTTPRGASTPEEMKKMMEEARAKGNAQAEKSKAEAEASKRSNTRNTIAVESELPAKYADYGTTDLTAKVKAGEKNDFTFELKDE